MKKIKYLLVAAYKNELKPLCQVRRQGLLIKKNTAFLAAGIGPVAAACGLTRFLSLYKPEVIISLGTAGVVNTKYKIGQVVWVRQAGLDSGSGDVYTPPGMGIIRPRTTATPGLRLKKPAKSEMVSVFCPQEISRSKQKRQRLLQMGFDAENLETYAFIHVSNQFRIPIIPLLGLTNIVGPQGHKEWLANEASVCANMAITVRETIRFVEMRGVEPLTFSLRTRRSTN